MCVLFVSVDTHRGQKMVGSPGARDTSSWSHPVWVLALSSGSGDIDGIATPQPPDK